MADKAKQQKATSSNASPSANEDSAPLFPPTKPGKPANYGTNNTLELLERIPSQVVDLKLDEVLTAVKTVDNLCDYPRCKTRTSLMGQDCEHCSKRFCFKHGLPEVHGCGEIKKREARKEFLHPKPLKTIRQEEEHKNAKKKLNEKLKNMQVARMQKTGSTNDKKKK
ncbi:PREDICTED: DNA-binding protein SMUBP-2 [Drosophila arizonae]|uniref:DNA-binding protein SMUBP-2 n=1 Tax=Drosophila arizonae TaxID=7263 RepID=A0ABM1PCW0_DROAR|nr:PREDICTED: DNA-binding protein SMUBP-2 [Drosophila arizonae]